MNDLERLIAVEAIKHAKARYFRGVDTGDLELVRGVLTEDCVLDYTGCCTDPSTGHDFLPQLNTVRRGHAPWTSNGGERTLVSVHHVYSSEIEFIDDDTANAIWSMSDRLYFPPGAPYSTIFGFGHYHETYAKVDGSWKIQTLRLERLRVEGTLAGETVE
jgi:hypothetical protein